MSRPEPPALRGPFAKLMAEIRACKECRTCRALRVRAFYSEPNPATIADWRKGKTGFKAYLGPLDRRVVFVGESPGGQVKIYNNTEPQRCWAVTAQDKRLHEMRVRYRFENCLLTDVVKCGVRRGGRHTDAEIDACGGFLARELDLVRPMVAVGVGNKAMFALRRVTRALKDPPVLFQITHYSARPGQAEREWPQG